MTCINNCIVSGSYYVITCFSPSGFMQNNDVPMHIANDCDDNYFVGCLDEVKFRSIVDLT